MTYICLAAPGRTRAREKYCLHGSYVLPVALASRMQPGRMCSSTEMNKTNWADERRVNANLAMILAADLGLQAQPRPCARDHHFYCQNWAARAELTCPNGEY